MRLSGGSGGATERLAPSTCALRRGGGGRRRRRGVDELDLRRAREHAVGARDAGHRSGLRAVALVHAAGAADLLADQADLAQGVLAVDRAGALQVGGQVGFDAELEDAVREGRHQALAVTAQGVALADHAGAVPAGRRDADRCRQRGRRRQLAGGHRDAREGDGGLRLDRNRNHEGADDGQEQADRAGPEALEVEERGGHLDLL